MKITKSAAKAALKPNEKPNATSRATSATGTSIAGTSAAGTSAAGTSVAGTKAAAPIPALTIIDVKRDVGFGNAVYLRGQGAGLTWERGLPLDCVDAQTWRWCGMAKDPITFKLLINDKVWSAGNDLRIAPGQKIEVAPEFA